MCILRTFSLTGYFPVFSAITYGQEGLTRECMRVLFFGISSNYFSHSLPERYYIVDKMIQRSHFSFQNWQDLAHGPS